MAEIRFNYGDKFTQTSDSNTGIGSTNPAAKLDIAGGTSAGSLRVSGIATLSSYQGFVNTKLSTTENLIVEAGQSGSVSGEVVIGTGQTISVSTGATTGQGGIQSLKVYETFMPPVGGTTDRPTDVKPGMVYYNKDFKTIEFWDGNFWKQVDNTTRRGRGVMGGRTSSPVQEDVIGFITIATRGNEQNFGDLTEVTQYPANGATSSSIRGLTMGGSGPAYKDVISYITIASEGNAIDFGNLTDARHYGAGMSSSTRAIVAGGYDGSNEVNIIDFVEIATLGNAVDFGDTNVARRNNSGCASPTRGIFAGGLTPANSNVISFVTTASTGVAIYFGDTDSVNRSVIIHDNDDDSLAFNTAGTERMSLTSAGDYLFLKTSADQQATGVQFEDHGLAMFTKDNIVAYFTRTGSDGQMIRFYGDTTSEGSINISGTSNDDGNGNGGGGDDDGGDDTPAADTTPPGAPSNLSVTTAANDNTPTITGLAEGSSTVKLYNGSTLISTVGASASGSFSITVANPLADGTYSFTVTATDSSNNVSNVSTIAHTINTSGGGDGGDGGGGYGGGY